MLFSTTVSSICRRMLWLHLQEDGGGWLGLGLVARDRCTKVSFIVGKIATRGVC